MKISELFKTKTVFSFEVFPPKRTAPLETIYNTLEELNGLNPDFISVTYGAGGGDNKSSTIAISSKIKNQYHIESAAHLTSINLTKAEVLSILKELKAHNIENIVALRGDINPEFTPKTDFKYASDLISFIKANGDFNLSGGCYPEGHFETPDKNQDLRNLKIKVDAGADHLISQLFFDNNYFYSFLDKARNIGINVPIEAGIMPVVNKKQIEKMVSLCNVDLPKKFTTMMARYEHNKEAMLDAGIAYAISQIVDLLAHGVDGIHLYTMNNAYIARRIKEAIGNLLI